MPRELSNEEIEKERQSSINARKEIPGLNVSEEIRKELLLIADSIDNILYTLSLREKEIAGLKLNEKNMHSVFRWLFGYSKFPKRKVGDGAYYWRGHLRKMLAKMNIKFE